VLIAVAPGSEADKSMKEREQAAATPSIDEAMNRVLRAEQEARTAVDACRAEAAAILAAAEERAKRVVQAADRRIRAAHQLADGAVERAVKGLLGAHPEVPPTTLEERSAALDQAVAALADEIIGAQR
jgi:hypothetical protein